MKQMNQIASVIRLRDLMDRSDGWGREEAAKVYPMLMQAVEKQAGADVIRISAKDIDRTDASFPRETVFAVAQRFRGTKVFCITDLKNESLADNWDMAGQKMGVGIIWWRDGSYQFLGPAPSQAMSELYALAVSAGSEGLSTAYAAKKLKKALNNVSTLLKQMNEKGYVVRRELVSPTGGKEFRYLAAV